MIKSIFQSARLIPIVFLFVGCAMPGNSYYLVTDTIPRHSTLGFSISPPPGVGWFERHKEDSLYYLKRTSPQSYSIYTKATEIHVKKAFRLPQDFHEYVRNQKEYRKLPERYQNVKFRYADIDELSPYCVRYSNTYEDHGLVQEKNTGFYQIRKSGIFCMHPESPQNGIDMYYLERTLSSSPEPSFMREGEQFLSSLRFYPIQHMR